jgi:hypothetical protein
MERFAPTRVIACVDSAGNHPSGQRSPAPTTADTLRKTGR